MQKVQIQDFVIGETSLICPACDTPFAAQSILRMPELTAQTTIEADLHRVLPAAILRAALIAICPCCVYTWWSTAFAPHHYVPDLLVPSPEIEYPKKFAHAVLTGRKNGAHALDRALLALNGLWCARETYIGAGPEQMDNYRADNERWLVLAAQELDEALKDPAWVGNRHRYSYLMGEVLRQLADFQAAVRYFDTVSARRAMLPQELIDHQRQLAMSGVSDPTVLPPYVVEAIFLAKPLPEIRPDEETAPALNPVITPVTPMSMTA